MASWIQPSKSFPTEPPIRLTILHRILLVAAIPLVTFLSAEIFTIRSLLQKQTVVHEMDSNIPTFVATSVLIDRL